MTLQVCDPQAACGTDTTTVEGDGNAGPDSRCGQADVTVYRNEMVALTGT